MVLNFFAKLNLFNGTLYLEIRFFCIFATLIKLLIIMKISFNWLKDYINFNLTPEEVAKYLTSCGLEVESINVFESVKGGLEGLIIGEVLTCGKHPDADKLSVTTVSIGLETPLNIVCGAPNVAAGQKVVVATQGTKIYTKDDVFTIKKSKIRGIFSEGMLCAEDELGLGCSHDGIIVLPQDTTVGTLAKNYFNIEKDYIFEIGLTPNRSDAISHLGVANDLMTVLQRHNIKVSPIKIPNISTFAPMIDNELIKVSIKEPDLCPRYTGICIENMTIKESPEWLKNRLNAIGIRPINNVVDATQYVMCECGQPLHAFDINEIKDHQIIIQTVEPNTKFTTLDHVERNLNGTELMICNATEPMCIAGVFGGLQSGVTEKTKSIFLESAYFNPVSIRKTSKLHNIKTDASFRYERGCNPDNVIFALKRAAILITKLSDGVLNSSITDVYPHKIEPVHIKLSYEEIYHIAGKEIPKEIVISILKNLNIEIKAANEENLSLIIPLNRVDVTRPIDVIEEILRIYDYDYIDVPDYFKYKMDFQKKDKSLIVQSLIGTTLSSRCFFESMNNSLTKISYAEDFDFINKNESIKILNPLSKDLGILRQSLIPNALENVSRNLNLKTNNIRLFEFGFTYHLVPNTSSKNDVVERYIHTPELLLTLSGKRNEETWNQKSENISFFDLKNEIYIILDKLNISRNSIEEEMIVNTAYSQSLQLKIEDKIIAIIGEIDSKLLKYFDIKQSVYIAELNMTNLTSCAFSNPLYFKELPKFPEVRRDLALVLNQNISFSDVKKVAKKYGGKHLIKINLFDVYEGEKVAKDKKSYALSLHLQNNEKTFTDDEIHKIIQKIVRGFETELNATLR